ncbi:MAG: ABC transporter ATP-binding protein [Muribaculaceae bacterium]|nr:ABC transporter ATP-binding protein [Muribaculaceae bacterium]
MKKQSNMTRLLRYVLSNYRFSFVAVAVCIAVTACTTLASNLFIRTLIDDYIVPLTKVDNPEYDSLAKTLLVLGLILTFGAACSYAYNRIMINVSQGTMLRLRRDMFGHMQSLPIRYFDTHSHGEIMSAYTNDVDTLRQMISQSLPQALNSVITIVATLCSMIVMSPWLTMVSLCLAGVMAFSTTKLGRVSRRHFVQQQKDLATLNGYIEEMVSGQKVVKVFCHEEKAVEDFERLNENLRGSAHNANRVANIVMPVNGNLGNLGYVLLAVVGAAISIGGYAELSLGTLIAFLTLNKSFTQPISQVSQQINSIITAAAGAERIFNILDEPSETDNGKVTLVNADVQADGSLAEVEHRTGVWAWKRAETDGDPILTKVEGGVDFNMVDFSYDGVRLVLEDIVLKAMPEQKIAFVGGTGAGKTTITNLINRFYDIQDGKVLYDGISINDISKPHLRRSLGMVLQETHLFTGTVLDNIRYGRLDATDEECIAAAQLVNAHDFIRRLSDGYNTMLSGDGGNLSQGERQLLAIARAAVADPPVLILDEATSSIDTRTEVIVQRGMDSLMKGRTTFVIAHRLSTVRNADCIIVLEKGHVIERGSHDELLALGGKYYHLFTGDGL